MLRKPFKGLLLAALLALGGGAGTSTATAQPGAPAASKPAAPAAPRLPDALAADIWARTARYIYQANPELEKIPALPATIRNGSVKAFDRALDEAVKLEGKPLEKSQVLVFEKTVFDKVQAQNPASPQELVAAISTALLSKHPERQGEPEFTRFLNDLNLLADGKGAATTAAPAALTTAEAADNPMAQAAPTADVTGPAEEVPATSVAAPATINAPQPSGTSMMEWLALAMSGLSLAGVIYLLLSRSPSAPAPVLEAQPATAQPVNKSRAPAFTWEEMQRYVQKELDKRQPPAPVAPALPAPPATKIPRPAAAAAQAVRTNGPVSQPAPVPQPGMAPQPAPAVVETASPAPEAPPAPVAPPAPRQRTQYVSEAPFNNVFPARALTDQPSSYSMFAIVSTEQHPDQGLFAVTGNLASHVRDHRTVLEPVCEYLNSPAGNETRIVTVREGQVRRQGHDWVVVAPAHIRFEA